MTLNRPPVNSLNLELLSDISAAIDELQNTRCKGMILTSSSKTVFSAGLDIMEMYKPDMDRCKKFWTALQDVWLKLYGSPFPTAAAINGHAPAGGCLLSMACEYRVMANNFTIGLNETKLGIVAPTWFMATMENTIGRRQTELALTTGKLFTTAEAEKVGLIDEVVDTKEQAIERCSLWLQQFKKIAPDARNLTKLAFRAKTIQDLEENRADDVERFLYFVQMPKVQKGIEAYLEALKNKK